MQTALILMHTELPTTQNFLQWYQNIFLSSLIFYKPNILNYIIYFLKYSGNNQKLVRRIWAIDYFSYSN